MRIGVKISLSCLTIAAIAGVAGWISALRSETVRSELEALRVSSIRELLAASDMNLALKATHAASQEMLADAWRGHPKEGGAARAAPDLSRTTQAVESGLAEFARKLAASRRATESGLALAIARGDQRAIDEERYELRVWLDELEDEFSVHRTLVGEFVVLAGQDPQAAFDLLNDGIEPHYREHMLPAIRAYRARSRSELHSAARLVERSLTEANRTNLIAAVAAAVLALLAGAFLTRSVARPVRVLRDAALEVGTGELTTRVPVARKDELGVLAEAFNTMAERLQATTVSKYYVDDIMHSIGDILLVTDNDGRIRSANRQAVEQLGWTEDELIGRDVADVVSAPDGDGELSVTTRDGSRRPVLCTPATLRDAAGRPQGEVWVAQDVTHLKRIEAELRALLAEKVVLLREVHHRVKNNLQIISSLLRLQASHATEDAAQGRFMEAETRVRSMALIHEQLYQSDDLARVDFRVYVERLAFNVLASAGTPNGNVELAVDVDPVPLDLDVAIPCGLILNELLVNAIRHAFPKGRRGTIHVDFATSASHATLSVADDGIGLPPAERIGGKATLGLRLVHALAGQLGGEVQVDGSCGTRVTLVFPTGSQRGEADAVVAGA